MSEKQYVVYRHLNKVNNKSYIGITCQTPKKRWGTNGSRYKECPYFWSAIQKYGWDGFDHIIVCQNLSHDQACGMERYLIKA